MKKSHLILSSEHKFNMEIAYKMLFNFYSTIVFSIVENDVIFEAMQLWARVGCRVQM